MCYVKESIGLMRFVGHRAEFDGQGCDYLKSVCCINCILSAVTCGFWVCCGCAEKKSNKWLDEHIHSTGDGEHDIHQHPSQHQHQHQQIPIVSTPQMPYQQPYPQAYPPQYNGQFNPHVVPLPQQPPPFSPQYDPIHQSAPPMNYNGDTDVIRKFE